MKKIKLQKKIESVCFDLFLDKEKSLQEPKGLVTVKAINHADQMMTICLTVKGLKALLSEVKTFEQTKAIVKEARERFPVK